MIINEFKIYFSNHAVKQMFSMIITMNEVKCAITQGETIKDYPDDRPIQADWYLHG